MAKQKLHNSVTLRAKKSASYSRPRIYPKSYKTYEGDIYIFWRIRFHPGEKMVPVKRVFDLNAYSGHERARRAEEIRDEIEDWLKKGKFRKEIQPDLSYEPALKTLWSVIEKELLHLSDRTKTSYKSAFKILTRYLDSQGLKNITLREFTRQTAKGYSDWLMEKKYSIRTHNNYLRFAGTFFGYCIEREILEANPFHKIKMRPPGSGGHLPFSTEQVKKIKDYCRLKFKKALLFTEFAEDSLMRTNELERLRVEDIDFENNKVRIVNNRRAGRTTKDKATRVIRIEKGIINKLKEHVKNSRPEDIVFGRGFAPSSKYGARDGVSKEYTEILRELGFGPEYTLYSWRHTGAVKKLREGWKIHELMHSLGHAQIGTTQDYLRGLGMEA